MPLNSPRELRSRHEQLQRRFQLILNDVRQRSERGRALAEFQLLLDLGDPQLIGSSRKAIMESRALLDQIKEDDR